MVLKLIARWKETLLVYNGRFSIPKCIEQTCVLVETGLTRQLWKSELVRMRRNDFWDFERVRYERGCIRYILDIIRLLSCVHWTCVLEFISIGDFDVWRWFIESTRTLDGWETVNDPSTNLFLTKSFSLTSKDEKSFFCLVSLLDVANMNEKIKSCKRILENYSV